jgi:cysteine synthase B
MIGAPRATAFVSASRPNASPERKRILAAYGAEVIFTDPAEGSDGAIRKCREVFAENPSAYFYPDQYNNPANWQAHYNATGPRFFARRTAA